MTTMTTTQAPDKAVAAVKIQQQHEALEKLGFARPRTFFALGDNAGEWTAEGYRRVSAEFEAKPFAIEGLRAFAAEVEREAREDHALALKDVGLAPDGRLVTPAGEWPFEVDAFRAFAGALQGQARKNAGLSELNHTAAFTATLTPDLRADVVNALLERSEDQQLVLRTRRNDGGERQVYATVTEKYHAYNADKVALGLADALERRDDRAARLDLQYDGRTFQARVLWHNYHPIREAGCGDVFRFGIQVETADDRSSSIKASLVAHINQCLNYLCIGKEHVEIGSRRHVGRASMRSSVAQLVEQARDRGSEVIDAWQAAGRDTVIEDANKAEPEKVFRKLVEKGFGRIAGHTTDELVARYMRAWQVQPGYSRLAFVNALTRAAHEATWQSPWAQREVESQAANLVFVRDLSI